MARTRIRCRTEKSVSYELWPFEAPSYVSRPLAAAAPVRARAELIFSDLEDELVAGCRRLRRWRGLAVGSGLESPFRTSGGRSRPPRRFPDPSLRSHRFVRATNAQKRIIASGCADGATRRNLQLEISSFMVPNRDFFYQKSKKTQRCAVRTNYADVWNPLH